MLKRRRAMPGTAATPAAVAQYAALLHRCSLTPEAAAAVAQAVLEFSEGSYSLSIELAPGWDDRPDYRDHALRGLRRSLAIDLDDNGLLPTAQPIEVIRPGPPPWHLTTVELVVPVRVASPESLGRPDVLQTGPGDPHDGAQETA
jgi:hypothetical protein